MQILIERCKKGENRKVRHEGERPLDFVASTSGISIVVEPPHRRKTDETRNVSGDRDIREEEQGTEE
jgi:hypothetical protein